MTPLQFVLTVLFLGNPFHATLNPLTSVGGMSQPDGALWLPRF